jgi:hypothetical protein
MGDQDQALGLRLGDQHAIEGVPVVPRETGSLLRVGEGDEELLEAAG